MFWVETIEHGERYCICSVGWRTFKIINAHVEGLLLSIHMTPEKGKRIPIFYLRNGECFEENSLDFNFQPFEHAKIEVNSGNVMLLGEVVDAYRNEKRHGDFPKGCPFADIETNDEWDKQKEEKILKN